jgi:hypothetical protein
MTAQVPLPEVVLFLGFFEGPDNILELSDNALYEYIPPDEPATAWLGDQRGAPPAGPVLCLSFGRRIYSPEGWIVGAAS